MEGEKKGWTAVTEELLEPPPDEEFRFPFTPYPIQKDFMKALFTALEGRKLGIFESPTGTVSKQQKLFLVNRLSNSIKFSFL